MSIFRFSFLSGISTIFSSGKQFFKGSRVGDLGDFPVGGQKILWRLNGVMTPNDRPVSAPAGIYLQTTAAEYGKGVTWQATNRAPVEYRTWEDPVMRGVHMLQCVILIVCCSSVKEAVREKHFLWYIIAVLVLCNSCILFEVRGMYFLSILILSYTRPTN